MKENVWFVFSCCTKKCGIPWKLCAISIRRDVVAREPEHKQKIQERPFFAQISRAITNYAIYDLGRSWLFEGYFFFITVSKRSSGNRTPFFFSNDMGIGTPKRPLLVTRLETNIK